MEYNFTKAQKKILRDLVGTVYERELEKELNILYAKYQDWKANKICGGELSTRIFEYNKGPSKRMFSFYNNMSPLLSVAYGFCNGFITKEEIPEELFEIIKKASKSFE